MTERFLTQWRRWLPWLAVGVGVLAVVAFVAGLTLISRYEKRAAAFDLSKIGDVREQSEIFDARGDLYGKFGEENRVVVPLADVSKNFIDALLAREDRRFWAHKGVDYRGVVRAMLTNLKAGRTRQGASTITQQLAKNACGLEGRTLDRKLLEAMLARRIEQKFSKQQILELYVNRIYFGARFYGIEAASRGYFGKPAKDLSVAEGAVLAALVRSPSKLSPARDAEAARAERDTVIDRMLEAKFITPEQATAAKASLINLEPSRSFAAKDSNMDAVMDELRGTLSPEVLQAGGLKVYITIDPQLQTLAERAVDQNLTEIENRKGYNHPRKSDFVPAPEGEPEKKTDYLQGALVAVENTTGAIRAAVGARDYAHSKYSRALYAQRQIGSTFKPFVYATAFKHGLLPGTLVDDSRIQPGELRGVSKNWSPENSDDDDLGQQPAAVGLLKSRNTMTVRVGEAAGLSAIQEMGRRIGLSDHIPDLPVIFLGAFECTLKDLTGAYTAFPNLGKMPTPHLISKVVDGKGNILFSAPTAQREVLDPAASWMVSSILQEVLKSGTAAKSAKLGWQKPSGGKTGTTNDYFDAWFVGYTSSLTCGVWVGFDQPQTIGDKAYGSAMALPIWVDFMKGVPEGNYPAHPLDNPGDLTEVKLCKISGCRATAACIEQGLAYDSKIPASLVPSKTCGTHQAAAPQVAYADTVPPAPPAGQPPIAHAVMPPPPPVRVADPTNAAPAPVAAVPLPSNAPPLPANAAPPVAVRPAAKPEAVYPVRRYGAETSTDLGPPPAAPTSAPARFAVQPSAPPPVVQSQTLPRPPEPSRPRSSEVSVTPNVAPAEVETAPAPANVPRRIVTRNGTQFEESVPVTVVQPGPQPAPPPAQPEKHRSRRLFGIFGDDEDGKKRAEVPAQPAVAVASPANQAAAPAEQPAATQSGTNGVAPQKVWVEKRGNQTITTTVTEVRRAQPAKKD